MQQTNLTDKRNKQTKAWVHRQMQGDTKLIILGNLGAHFISQYTNTNTSTNTNTNTITITNKKNYL